MAKYQEICDILVTRIRQVEYADSQLPNLRQLAEDMGVSYLPGRRSTSSKRRASSPATLPAAGRW